MATRDRIRLSDYDEEDEDVVREVNAMFADKGLTKIQIVAKDETCAICLGKMEIGSEGTSTGCKHTFHEICIKKWTNRNSSCPICRSSLASYGVKVYKQEWADKRCTKKPRRF